MLTVTAHVRGQPAEGLPALPDAFEKSLQGSSVLKTALSQQFTSISANQYIAALQDAIDRGWFLEAPSHELSSPCLRTILQTAREIAEAMRWLHSMCVVHGDLTGGNVLLDGAEKTPSDARGFVAKVQCSCQPSDCANRLQVLSSCMDAALHVRCLVAWPGDTTAALALHCATAQPGLLLSAAIWKAGTKCWHLQISDFGISRRVQKERMTNSYGTCTHMVSWPVTVAQGAFPGRPNSMLTSYLLMLKFPSDRHAALCALQPPELMTEGHLTPATDVW